MPITPTEQSRAVALALGMWKEGEKCLIRRDDRGFPIIGALCQHGHYVDHDIPPPDLASPAGADLLMGALLKAGYKLDQWQAPAGVHFSILRESKLPATLDEALLPENREQFQFAVDPDWKRAQLDAAYQLLCAKE